MTSVHVVIVNRNAGDSLRTCVASVASSAGAMVKAVTVVDNASRDGSTSDLTAAGLPLTLIHNASNVGFAAACNQGAVACIADYLLFLNPDTQVLPDTLARVVQFMESPAGFATGICGAQMLDEDGMPGISCARFPSLRIMFGKMTRLDRVLPILFPSHHLRETEMLHSRRVDQVIGAFFLVRTELFERLGGFDERFFLYFEEVDFALRARTVGAGSYFVKDAVVVHTGQVSSDQDLALRLHQSLRSRQIYAYRHWPRWQAHTLLMLTLVVESPVRVLRALMMRDGLGMRATLVGCLRLLRDLPMIMSANGGPSR